MLPWRFFYMSLAHIYTPLCWAHIWHGIIGEQDMYMFSINRYWQSAFRSGYTGLYYHRCSCSISSSILWITGLFHFSILMFVYWYLIMILKFILLMTEAEQLLNGLWASWKFSLVPEYIFPLFSTELFSFLFIKRFFIYCEWVFSGT